MRSVFLWWATVLFFAGQAEASFQQTDSTGDKTKAKVDIQGHRGARGVLPENTIPSFIYAIEAGATTIELDVVVSKDRRIVVSHEPWMSAKICSHPDGQPVTEDEKDKLNIYEMDYSEVRNFDCGSRGNDKFPEQKPTPVCKPLLIEVFLSVEKFLGEKGLPPVQYNIEIKSDEKDDNKSNPEPAVFAKMVYKEVTSADLKDRVIIQSFDVRPLQELKKLDKELKLSLLVANAQGVSGNLKKLGFTPQAYSPYYMLTKKRTIKKCHALGVKIIPWTVNSEADIKRLLDLGVDGIITDFPKKAVDIVNGN